MVKRGPRLPPAPDPLPLVPSGCGKGQAGGHGDGMARTRPPCRPQGHMCGHPVHACVFPGMDGRVHAWLEGEAPVSGPVGGQQVAVPTVTGTSSACPEVVPRGPASPPPPKTGPVLTSPQPLPGKVPGCRCQPGCPEMPRGRGPKSRAGQAPSSSLPGRPSCAGVFGREKGRATSCV